MQLVSTTTFLEGTVHKGDLKILASLLAIECYCRVVRVILALVCMKQAYGLVSISILENKTPQSFFWWQTISNLPLAAICLVILASAKHP